MDKPGEDKNGLYLGKYLKNVGPSFFKNLDHFISHVHSWKIIFNRYVAVILQIKDSCSANLTFRAHHNKIKQNYLK